MIIDINSTKINGLIRKLLQCFSRRIYIGYTATPFANILVHDEKNHQFVGEKTGKKYQLGDKTRVMLIKADQVKRRLDFQILT